MDYIHKRINHDKKGLIRVLLENTCMEIERPRPSVKERVYHDLEGPPPSVPIFPSSVTSYAQPVGDNHLRARVGIENQSKEQIYGGTVDTQNNISVQQQRVPVHSKNSEGDTVETSKSPMTDEITEETFYIESLEEKKERLRVKKRIALKRWFQNKWSHVSMPTLSRPQTWNPVTRFKTWRQTKKVEMMSETEELWAEVDRPLVVEKEEDIPSINPEFENSIQALVDCSTPMSDLIRKGLNKDKLANEGIDLDKLKSKGYTLREISMILPNYNDLLEMGLTKYHLGSNWTARDISQTYPVDLVEICSGLGFKANDFPMNGLTIHDMAGLGIGIDVLVNTLEIAFDTLYAWNIDFATFADTFNVQLKDIERLKLSRIQQTALASERDWTASTLAEHFNVPISQIRTMWVCIGIPAGFKL